MDYTVYTIWGALSNSIVTLGPKGYTISMPDFKIVSDYKMTATSPRRWTNWSKVWQRSTNTRRCSV